MLTTTIGAYPKPDDVPIKDWFQKDGGTDSERPTEGYAETRAQHAGTIDGLLDRATIDVVREQDELGIDIPTDGEIRRENYIHYHCRHLKGVDFEALTEKQMRGHYAAHLPTITGPVLAGPAFLVRDWEIAQSATKKPLKMTVPGTDDHRRQRGRWFLRRRPASPRDGIGRCAQCRNPPPRRGRLPGDSGGRAGVRAKA